MGDGVGVGVGVGLGVGDGVAVGVAVAFGAGVPAGEAVGVGDVAGTAPRFGVEDVGALAEGTVLPPPLQAATAVRKIAPRTARYERIVLTICPRTPGRQVGR